MAVDHFCLRWNNYKTNMVTELVSLREDEDLVDVSLHCEGRVLKAHKVILSACSSYFRRVFKESPCRHPSVILKDVHHEEVESLLNFIYQGVVYISEKKLTSFLRTAEALEIRGLTGAATEMQDGSFSYLASTQTAPAEQNTAAAAAPPPPPPLLTANLVNSWKQQGTINTTTSSMKSPSSNPPSPSLPPAKRRKCVPNKVILKDNSECSDTNSNQGCSEAESDVVVVKREKSDSENRDPEEDCNSLDEISREESSREENPSLYEMMESDETEEENGEVGNKAAIPNNDHSGNLNASSSSLFGFVPTYSSQSSTEQNSSAPGDTRLGRRPCPLCQKIISNKSNLLKHMRIRHSDEHNPAGCTICNKVFKNKYSLRAHINIYHKEMNAGVGNVSLSASYSPQLSSSEYNTHHQQQPTSNSHPDYHVSSQRSVSLSYSATSSNGYNLVSSSINSDLSSYEMVKENILNQFNISNLPLT